MKTEENQLFSSFDFITLVFSLVVVIGISAPIVKRNFQPDNSIEMAKQDLNHLGETLLNSGSGEQKGRSIASIGGKTNAMSEVNLESLKKHLNSGEWEGEMGKDPWGNSYHFSFLKNGSETFTHVAIWSDGPDKKNETVMRGQIVNSEKSDAIYFKGDDVGSVVPIR